MTVLQKVTQIRIKIMRFFFSDLIQDFKECDYELGYDMGYKDGYNDAKEDLDHE